jgi:DNA modification methylase
MLIRADARQLPVRDRCVQCVVTSPPYFGLRDYGVSGQIGLEPTPDAYVHTLVSVFREVRRVLTDDGVCWLNVGDSYATGASDRTAAGFNARYFRKPEWADGKQAAAKRGLVTREIPSGFKPKDLLGIPWRVAFALQADGWYLRSDIIWAKPNPMPESVTDRPTKAHEYLFLLTKSERYYYDAVAIAEETADLSRVGKDIGRWGNAMKPSRASAMGRSESGNEAKGAHWIMGETRNRRTVWTIPTMPYSGSHFAVMPEKLVEPCILAGSRLGDRVFDPFLGSGTVGAVAERLGRRWIGIDLNSAYHALAKDRTAQLGFRFDEVSA